MVKELHARNRRGSRKESNGESQRTVGRVVAVLELLADPDRPLRLTEIARAIDAPFSSTHGLMQVLVRLRYVELSTDRRYTSGPRLARLGVRIHSRLRLIEVARPRIVRLSIQLDEDVYLALYEGASVSHIERIEGRHPLRLNVTLGVPRPLHATAAGKLYLASLAPSELEALLHDYDLRAFTASTITRADALKVDLERVRHRGFSISDQESIEGVVSTGAPVYDANGRLIAAITSPIPLSRYHDRERAVARALIETAAEVSAALGWIGPGERAARRGPAPA